VGAGAEDIPASSWYSPGVIEENLASDSVVALPAADASAVAWREAGRLFVTVVAKASFSLTPGAEMARCEPQPIIGAELHYGNNPVRSVRFTPDLAPRLNRADVLFTGHGHAPSGAPAVLGAARLVVFAGEWAVLDKTILLQDPRGFQRIPLVYERAFGGSTVLENPLGIGGDADGGEPTLVDIIAPRRPIGFGPIARAWPARKRLLGKTQRRVLEGAVAEIPAGFDWSYFQSAPRDQQIDALRGDETIALFGLHPTLPVLVARLPRVRGRARLHHLTGSGIPEGHPLDLTLDTLRIDGDEERCTVVCRGAFEIATEAALGEMLILAGVEASGEAIVWPDPLPARPSRAALARPPENARAGTVLDTRAAVSQPLSPKSVSSLGGAAPVPTHVLGDQQEDPQECETKKRRTPFGPPGRESALPFAIPAPPPAPPPPPPTTTLMLASDDEIPRSGVALPFPQPPPALTEPHPARGGSIPGAPWSNRPVASVPLIDPGEMTVDSPENAAALALQSLGFVNPAVAPIEAIAPTEPLAPIAPTAPVAPIAPAVSGSSSPQGDASAPAVSRFFHDLRRMKEADSVAPLAPDEAVSLERCARITVELAEQRASRIATLEAHGLNNARWTAAERGWHTAIDEEGKSGGHALRDAFDMAYMAAWESIRGALKVTDYARLVLASETGKLSPALDALAIRRTVWTRMKRCWDRRVAVDPRLSAEVEREIAALRGA
jgi:hypothetical protein